MILSVMRSEAEVVWLAYLKQHLVAQERLCVAAVVEHSHGVHLI
jgi:hypothetical protein